MNWKIQLAYIWLIILILGSMLSYAFVRSHHPAKPKQELTPEQQYAVGYALGELVAHPPLTHEKPTAYDRGFFAGMSAALNNVEGTNVLAELDRLQKSNVVLRQQLKLEQ
jgi:hypothetical protein